MANLSRAVVDWRSAVICGGLAAVGVVLFWGFTVDDALISARVAWNLARGYGYKFNTHGAVSDAVTPLGWANVLAATGKRSVLGYLQVARGLGAVTWILGASWYGYASAAAGSRPRSSSLLLVSSPLGAWAGSGMETGVVASLGALSLGRSPLASLAAGVAAGERPELIPFALVLAHWRASRESQSTIRAVSHWGLTIGPTVVVGAIREIVFKQVSPLSALAKPSDISHGIMYVIGAMLLTGPFWLWLGPGWRQLSIRARYFAAAVLIELLALVLVGGDWMPLWRLCVPVLPAAIWVATELTATRRKLRYRLLEALALVTCALVAATTGWSGRKVMAARRELMQRAQPLLADARLIAALDVGWVGAASASDILDLAGVTDLRVARLPGGHTTKRIPNSLFDSLRPDRLVILSAPGETPKSSWSELKFGRGVENRVSQLDYWRNCSTLGHVDLKFTRQSYVVVGCD